MLITFISIKGVILQWVPVAEDDAHKKPPPKRGFLNSVTEPIRR